MPSREHVERFVKVVEEGHFVEAMEEFYAADASAQENNEPPRTGLAALLDHERATLQRFKRIEARCVRPILVDGDQVVIHWQFVFHHSSGAVIRLDELARQTWHAGKLASERFFYDPGQMRP